MKTYSTRMIPLFVASLMFAGLACADDGAYTQVLKKREAVLSEILARQEARYGSGTADEEAVGSARLALYSFRRDTAVSNAGKIKQQELIVAVWEKKLAGVNALAKSGVGGREAVLFATDSLLQAQQLLEELRLPPKVVGAP